MALYKRNKTWWTDFFVDGQRFRQSLDTSDWREAQSKEKDLIATAKSGKLASAMNRIVKLPFKQAAELFLADREPGLAVLSIRTEKERSKRVSSELGNARVSSITPGDVLAYIRKRKAEGVANATVNRELDIIRGVLKKAKRWHLFADEIKNLPVRQKIGRALTENQRAWLLRMAARRSDWQAAYYAAVLALNTTARGCELKGLRWCDVDLINDAIYYPSKQD